MQFAPARTAQFGIVMRAIDLARKVPSQSAANDNVGGEVLLAGNARQRHGRRQAVSGDLRQRPRIFMRDHARDRPGDRGVLGGKRRPSLKERPTSVSLQWPGTLGHGFEQIRHGRAVESCLAGQKSGFAQMVVVRQMPPEVRTAGGADERVGGVVGNTFASVDLRSFARNLPRNPVVARHQRSRKGNEGKEGFGVLPVHVERCGPELFLVERQMLHEGRDDPIFWIASHGQERWLVFPRLHVLSQGD